MGFVLKTNNFETLCVGGKELGCRMSDVGFQGILEELKLHRINVRSWAVYVWRPLALPFGTRELTTHRIWSQKYRLVALP